MLWLVQWIVHPETFGGQANHEIVFSFMLIFDFYGVNVFEAPEDSVQNRTITSDDVSKRRTKDLS